MRIFRYTIFNREALLYGKTVHTFVYASDTRKRYVRIYYSAAKAPVNAQGLQSEELMKAIAGSTRSYEDILRCIKGEASEEG